MIKDSTLSTETINCSISAFPSLQLASPYHDWDDLRAPAQHHANSETWSNLSTNESTNQPNECVSASTCFLPKPLLHFHVFPSFKPIPCGPHGLQRCACASWPTSFSQVGQTWEAQELVSDNWLCCLQKTLPQESGPVKTLCRELGQGLSKQPGEPPSFGQCQGSISCWPLHSATADGSWAPPFLKGTPSET